MEQATFERLMLKAETLHRDNPNYLAGYRRGLRRRYHGEKFGTSEEHEKWMAAEDLRGEGYRAGFVPSYCTQNAGDCETCSLVSYGRDCMNEKVS